MAISFDVENLNKLLRDFYVAVGIRISVFDAEFRLVTEYPREAPEFCSLVRSSEAGREGCRACDEAACLRAKRLRAPHVYRCHAGLTEAITPIMPDGVIAGYVILAHILPEENYAQAVNAACVLASKYGPDERAFFSAVTKIPPRTEAQIHACVHLLDAIASYVCIKDLARGKEDVAARIDGYIRRHLEEPLTGDDLCRKFLVSRTKLYQISVQNFGMGITQYVTEKRIERAKALLREGSSVSDAAARAGFSDYNYFCRVFKKHAGLTPARYRAERARPAAEEE